MSSNGGLKLPQLVERVVVGLVVVAVALKLLASTLPHLLLSIVVLAVVVAGLRLVFFHTRRW